MGKTRRRTPSGHIVPEGKGSIRRLVELGKFGSEKQITKRTVERSWFVSNIEDEHLLEFVTLLNQNKVQPKLITIPGVFHQLPEWMSYTPLYERCGGKQEMFGFKIEKRLVNLFNKTSVFHKDWVTTQDNGYVYISDKLLKAETEFTQEEVVEEVNIFPTLGQMDDYQIGGRTAKNRRNASKALAQLEEEGFTIPTTKGCRVKDRSID